MTRKKNLITARAGPAKARLLRTELAEHEPVCKCAQLPASIADSLLGLLVGALIPEYDGPAPPKWRQMH